MIRVYDEPGDPQANVRFSVRLHLTAEECDGRDVGWLIQFADLKQYDESGHTIAKWSEWSPYVDTEDGLWWVHHGDEDNPKTAEFAELPLTYGTAVADGHSGPDLEYDLAGTFYGLGAPFVVTTALDYNFTKVGAVEPEAEGEEEPAEVDDNDEEELMPAGRD